MAARSYVSGLALMWRKQISPFQSRQRVAYPYAVQAYVQPLTSAVLNFTGPTNLIKGTSKGMTAILSFAGITNLGKTLTKNLVAATLTFTGVLRKVTSKNFVPAVLSFTGPVNLKKVISKGVVAILSFSGQNMASSLYNSFIYNAGRLYGSSTFVKNTQKGLVVAILSFTGPTKLANFITKKLVAAVLSFSGVFSKQLPKVMAATLTFTGSSSHGIGKTFIAALNFVGGIASQLFHPIHYIKNLTATLSFTGVTNIPKSIGKTFVAVLNFLGTILLPAPPRQSAPGTRLMTLPADIDIATTETYPYQIDLTNYLSIGDTIGSYYITLIQIPGGHSVGSPFVQTFNWGDSGYDGMTYGGTAWRGIVTFNGNIMIIPLFGSALQLGQKYQLNVTFVANINKIVTFLTFIHVVN
jgi:hypothetical protein